MVVVGGERTKIFELLSKLVGFDGGGAQGEGEEMGSGRWKEERGGGSARRRARKSRGHGDFLYIQVTSQEQVMIL